MTESKYLFAAAVILSAGVFAVKNIKTPAGGITVKIPSGALTREADIYIGRNDGKLTASAGKPSEIAINISAEKPLRIGGASPIGISVGADFGENVIPVPYAIRPDGSLSTLQLTNIDRDKQSFSFDVFYLPLIFTWIYADIK